MDVSLLIRLIDQVSGPANSVRQALKRIGDTANEMKSGFAHAIRDGFSIDNIETATRNAEDALQKARGRLLGAVAMATSVAAPLVQAGQFDQSMRGLDKVLDVSASRLKELRDFALNTSALIPVAGRELLDLMSNAAQGGVPQEELEAFSLYVAKAAVAFDMAGGEIGDRFAKLRNVYKLNQQGIEDLGDATNHLSNNMAAKASELTDFTNRAAGGASLLKLTATQATAAGAAMVAAGIVPETAARGFNALATRIATGGKKVDEAFKSIGLSRKSFTKDLNDDAPAALTKLFEAMQKSPEGMTAMVDLVGMDFSDDFSKLVNNPELLAKAFDLVADKQAYAGSATEEAAKQGEGAVKKWDLLLNKLNRLAIVAGDVLLPGALQVVDALGSMIDQVAGLAQANPQLFSALVTTAAGLLLFGVASRAAAFAVAAIRVPLIGLVSTFLKFDESGRNIATGWRLMAGAGRVLGGGLGLVRAAAVAVVGALGAVSAPVWAVAGAVAAAGFAIWKYWDRISAFASGFASAFSGIFAAIGDAAGSAGGWIADRIGSLFNVPSDRVAAFKQAVANAFDFSGLVEGAKQVLSNIWTWLGGFFSQETLSDDQRAGVYASGQKLGEQLIKGITDFVEAWIAPIQDLFNFALNIQWPEPPDWLRWLMDRAGSVASSGGEALAQGGAAVSNWWDGLSNWAGSVGGNGDAPPVPATGAANAGAAIGGLVDDLSGAGRQAGDGLADGGQRGADALARGGQQAADALRQAASEIGSAARNLRSAAAGRGGVSAAIAGARTGALHGGTE